MKNIQQRQSPFYVTAVQLLSLLSIFGLMLTSYKLWWPESNSQFPQVPALSIAVNASKVWDYGGLSVLLISLFICGWKSVQAIRLSCGAERHAIEETASPQPISIVVGHWIWWLVVISGLSLVLLNQHRLQAWFYQLLIFSLIFTLRDSEVQLKWLRRIIVSVYFFSALGKLDFEFAHTVGQNFLQATAGLLGLSLSDWSENDRVVIALLFPLVELLIGIGLVTRRTRRASGVAAFAFHLVLAALVFGPLKHSWGVFLWNLQFSIQALLLFALPNDSTSIAPSASLLIPHRRREYLWHEWAVALLLSAVLFLPIGERIGYWDHWPSWGLYAPHSSRVRVTIAKYAVKQLPQSLYQILDEVELEQVEIELPLARWSFHQLGVPIYPQSRFQLGVARKICDSLESDFAIRAEIRSTADRFTGDRKTIILSGVREIRQAAGPFWLGSMPRR